MVFSFEILRTYTWQQTDNMRPSLFISGLLPAVAIAQQQQAQQLQQQPPAAAVNPSPSLPNVTPPFPLPELQQQQQQLQPQQQLRFQSSQVPGVVEVATAQPTDTNTSSLGSRRSTMLQARSEGTLGQSPWIGMAIGLTCTALAAVTLG